MDVPPEVVKAAPGAAGAVTALLFFRGDSKRRGLALCLSGAVLASIVGPATADLLHTSPPVAGYLSGLFGMAIVAKVFELLAGLSAAKLAADLCGAILKRIRG